MPETPGGYRLLNSVLAHPNTPVWDMLADAGIDLDLISVDAVGVWNLIAGDTRIAFGPAETETGDTAPGWDWTRYTATGGEEEVAGQDYAETDAELLRILTAATGSGSGPGRMFDPADPATAAVIVMADHSRHLAMAGPELRAHLAATLREGGHYVPRLAAAAGPDRLIDFHQRRHELARP